MNPETCTAPDFEQTIAPYSAFKWPEHNRASWECVGVLSDSVCVIRAKWLITGETGGDV